MSECYKTGCRKLKHVCEECGKTVNSMTLSEGLKMGNEWISVKDELPPEGKPCLLYQTWPPGTMFNLRLDRLERTKISLGGMIRTGDFLNYENQFGDDYMKHVTHWMPLPLPPAKDE